MLAPNKHFQSDPRFKIEVEFYKWTNLRIEVKLIVSKLTRTPCQIQQQLLKLVELGKNRTLMIVRTVRRYHCYKLSKLSQLLESTTQSMSCT